MMTTLLMRRVFAVVLFAVCSLYHPVFSVPCENGAVAVLCELCSILLIIFHPSNASGFFGRIS